MAKKKKVSAVLDKKVRKAKKLGKRILILLLVLVVLWVVTLIFAPTEEAYQRSSATYVENLELPANPEDLPITRHTGFSLVYDEEHEQPIWVAYHLSKEELYGTSERKDNFRSDSSILTDSASLSDYRGSGYDRAPYPSC